MSSLTSLIISSKSGLVSLYLFVRIIEIIDICNYINGDNHADVALVCTWNEPSGDNGERIDDYLHHPFCPNQIQVQNRHHLRKIRTWTWLHLCNQQRATLRHERRSL